MSSSQIREDSMEQIHPWFAWSNPRQAICGPTGGNNDSFFHDPNWHDNIMMSINILSLCYQAGVVGVSISLMDGNTGPFHLEIKDIGLHNDPTADDEKFAYEMYKLPDFWAGY